MKTTSTRISKILTTCALLLTLGSSAQTSSTEYFESFTVGAPAFTNATTSDAFTLTNVLKVASLSPTLAGVNANTPASVPYSSVTVVSSTSGSANYIDNSTSPATGQVNSIKATGSTVFKANEIYIYPSSQAAGDDPTTDGTVIIKGKLAGNPVFTTTITATTFTNTAYNANYQGFTYVSLATYSTNVITELEFTLAGAYQYIALDNFRFTTATVTPLSATSTQTNVACYGTNTGAASVSVSGGASPYTYTWSPSGGNGVTATGLSAGGYTCIINDALSNVYTKVVTITQPTSALSATTASTNVSCNGGSNGVASVSVSGGTASYGYSWAPSGGTGATASGLAHGNYTCTITDNNSCTFTKVVTVSQPNAIATPTAVTNIACNGGSNGAASVSVSGGTSPYLYSWAPSGGTGATATGLSAGSYTCTITDNNSCTSTKVVTVSQPSAITVTTNSTNVSCNGGSNGVASVNASGGTGSLVYSWAPSGGNAATASGLSQGNYTCTITDANTCSITKVIALIQPTALTATTNSTNIACNGGSNGVASVNASGGTGSLAYSWSPSGGNAATATGLSQGNYTCTITDANTCSITKVIALTQPSAITATTTQTNVACNGGSNGVASVNASGGTGPLAYFWAPSGGTGATASGVAQGNYTCTITDANSCFITKVIAITQPSAITATTTQTDVACNGGSNGVTAVNASGGTGSLAYAWAPSGGIASTATGLPQGNYTCTITDANTCYITKVFTLTQPNAIAVTPTQTNVACNGGSNGATSVNASGGTGSLAYSWAPSGGNAGTATGLAQGNYTCTITDANSCSITEEFTLTQPSAIVSSQSPTVCAGGSVVVGTHTYSTVGTYTDVLTSYHGCDSTVTTNLTVQNAIDISILVSGGIITSNQNGASYQWVDCNNSNSPVSGATSQSYTTTSGSYAVVITLNGCVNTSTCVTISSTDIRAISAANDALNIYPNPNNGTFTLSSKTESVYMIVNEIGQVTQTIKLDASTNYEANIQGLANGIYFIIGLNGNATVKKKIIITH